ncbi:DNA-directed DNA polymerase eta rad30 [Entomortierella beljakovae]|nr:DNA-directed DNA polymerase eta rad30 [Entomortierella beljakovae]
MILEDMLGLSPDVPLVSQQWNAIIAVNYSARKFGITRLHHSVFDAKQLCPELVCAHVATLGPGDSQPDYYPSPSRYTHKVSLDPYRKASAKIFTVFRRLCPKYQKGGLDEVFMDVTDIVNERIMEIYGGDLSNWDSESTEMIDWERDHPEAGVVFGLPTRASNTNHVESALQEDSDEEDGDLPKDLDGIRTDESDLDVEIIGNENGHESENQSHNDDIPHDDFDFDLEQFLGVDFDESFSLSQPDEIENPQSKSVDSTSRTGHQFSQPDTVIEEGENTEKLEKSEEELKKEKDEQLRQEAETLRPYYGIPEGTFEEEFWSEMQLLKAAEFCNEIRFAVKEELGYTCSAGIGNNRLLAKLGSGMNKPFNQTIVLPKYIPDLLQGIKLSKIRNLGGKFGKQVKEDYNIERASQLWPVPLRQLQLRYGDQAGLELWQWCRGIDHVGIKKIKSKSMCSHKSFIPALSDMEEIQFWISSMGLELVSRMQEEFEETGRWPRTIALGFYGGRRAQQAQQEQELKSSFRAPHQGSRSMPLGSRFEYGGVEGIAKKMYGLLEKLIKEADSGNGRPILPLILLTLTVSNFSDGHESTLTNITKFFSKVPTNTQQHQSITANQKNPAEIINDNLSHSNAQIESIPNGTRTNQVDEPSVKRRFFQSRSIQTETHEIVLPNSLEDHCTDNETGSPVPGPSLVELRQDDSDSVEATLILCEECPSPGQRIPVTEWEQHKDYHFALGLFEDDRKQQQLQRQQQQSSVSSTNSSKSSSGIKRTSSMPSGSSSTRGKRKKGGGNSGLSTTLTGDSSTPSLAKFFKPSNS